MPASLQPVLEAALVKRWTRQAEQRKAGHTKVEGEKDTEGQKKAAPQSTRSILQVSDVDGEAALTAVRAAFNLAEVRAVLDNTKYAAQELSAKIDTLTPDDAAKIVAAWHQLGCRNAQIANYGMVLSAVLGCNNNPLLLGVDAAAKAALFYIVKYVSKDALEPLESLSILCDVKEYTDKWPSVADDAGPERQALRTNTQAAMAAALLQDLPAWQNS
jgi:hypothetical protein